VSLCYLRRQFLPPVRLTPSYLPHRSPNFGSILNGDCQQSGLNYARHVRRSLMGETIRQVAYPRLIEDESFSDVFGHKGVAPPAPSLEDDVMTKASFFQSLVNNAFESGDLTRGDGRHLAVPES
jgi:hypothetical protein